MRALSLPVAVHSNGVNAASPLGADRPESPASMFHTNLGMTWKDQVTLQSYDASIER